MNATTQKALFLSAFLLATVSDVSAASAQAYYENQSGSAAMNYQPYYVAQAPATPSAYPPVQTITTSTSSSASGYDTASNFFAPIGARIISDPLYLPLQGQVYGSTAFTMNTGLSKSYNATGAESTRSFNYADSFSQNLAYGATDDLDFHVTESFVVSGTDVDHQLRGTTSQANANGFTDPTFGATYRAVDQRHSAPLDWDLTLNYAPDMMDASSAGGGHDGSENAGRQAVTMETLVGREMKGFTIAGLAGVTYNGKKTYTTLANNDTNTNSSYWNYFTALETQTRITDRFSINGDIRYNGYDDNNATNQTTGENWINKTPDDVDFTVALNYHFIPNRLVGQLSYDNILYTTSGASTDHTTPTSNSTTSELGHNILGARLFYTFN
jgi:hypothetical protein